MENKTELINTIIDCVNDSIDLDSNKVSLGVLIALLNDNIPEQLTIGGVVKSFVCDTCKDKGVVSYWHETGMGIKHCKCRETN